VLRGRVAPSCHGSLQSLSGPVRPRQGGSPEIQAEHPKLHAAVGELLVAFHRACGSPVRLSEVRDPEMLKAISMVGTDERQEDN